MKRFVVVDGHSLLFRAYHALPKTFTDRAGHPVNAVYGFMSMLIRVVSDLKPDYLAMAFDSPGPTFRHAELVTYKEGRPEMETEMQEQQPIVFEMLRAFSIPVFLVEGYEGEDILATIVAKLKNSRRFGRDPDFTSGQKSKIKDDDGMEFYIVSGDRDVLQLVDETTRVYSPKKGLADLVIYDEKSAVEVFGVTPAQIPDYKGLRGDPSDRIPGVYGIGEKTAKELVLAFGSIENLYRNIGQVRRNFGEAVEKKLLHGAEPAVLSKRLATITGDVPLSLTLPECRFHDLKTNVSGLEFLNRLNFRSLLKRLTGQSELKTTRKTKKKGSLNENQTRLL